MTPKTDGPCLKCGFWNCEGGDKCTRDSKWIFSDKVVGLADLADPECKSVDTSAQVVAHPAHYTTGKIEVLDFILDQKLGYCLGNAIKYICRCNHKGDKRTDLQKAIQYLKFEIEKEGA